MSLLVAEDVVHRYGRREVVRGVDLSLEAGELVALLGPNGAGKTTLMKMLVGLYRPRRGTVTGPPAHQVGWVPQGAATWQRLTVRENLELFARLAGSSDPGLAARAASRRAELDRWYDRLASELSGGLRQRLNVAVGLLGDPSVVVLDEPTTGVDLHHRIAMFELLRARASGGAAVLYSTHTLEDAEVADRVLVLVEGSVVHVGSVDDLARHAPGADPHVTYGPGRPPSALASDPRAAGLLALWRQEGEG